jgi:hypothetical protein
MPNFLLRRQSTTSALLARGCVVGKSSEDEADAKQCQSQLTGILALLGTSKLQSELWFTEPNG